MMATEAFDNVYLTGFSDQSDENAQDVLAAAILPVSWQESDDYDDTVSGLMQIDGKVTIFFLARDEDQQVRDEKCELLLNTAANALNGQSLASLTFPEWTKFKSVQWIDPVPPERKIRATFAYSYYVDTFTSFATDS
jgi:hypothetical protein